MSNLLNGAAMMWAAEKFGGPMTVISDTKSIGVTVGNVLTPDPERVMYAVVNMSSNLMYVHFEQDVSNTNGIFLAANGGSIEVYVEADLVLPTFPLYAVSDGASSPLYVVEVRRFAKSSALEVNNAT